MVKKIDYSRISIPDNENYKEWSYAERRAYLLDLIQEAGHPRAFNQTEMGKKFGVSKQQIHQDIDAIADSVSEYLGRNADLFFDSIYGDVIDDLREEEDRAELRRWLKDFKEFLMERGSVEKEQEDVKVTHDVEGSIHEEIRGIKEALESE